ncbi:MAG: hypothetical protein AB8G99_26875, partial [Planctomycetaceae bacterium]
PESVRTPTLSACRTDCQAIGRGSTYRQEMPQATARNGGPCAGGFLQVEWMDERRMCLPEPSFG